MKPIILIKIGGSLITDKNKPLTINGPALDKICQEIKKAREITGRQLIVGHGAGSFAHFVARKYKTKNCFCAKTNIFGMADIQNSASRLNRIVVENVFSYKVPAISI